MTIAEGIRFNKLRKLSRRRNELVADFNRIAAAHRDASGMYIKGSHSGAEYVLGLLAKVDSDIAQVKNAQ